MKKLILFLTTCIALPLYGAGTDAADGGKKPERGEMVGGIGADGNFHFLLVSNTGALSATVTGAGDATAANQTSVQANPGSDATKAIAVQGVTSGKPLAVKIDQTTPGTTNAVSVQTYKGAANYANGQVATSTTAGTLVAARATRRSVTIRNTDAAITVYVGAATVTSGNGMPLKAGESINVDTTALIQVIAASGTPTVAYVETYD